MIFLFRKATFCWSWLICKSNRNGKTSRHYILNNLLIPLCFSLRYQYNFVISVTFHKTRGWEEAKNQSISRVFVAAQWNLVLHLVRLDEKERVTEMLSISVAVIRNEKIISEPVLPAGPDEPLSQWHAANDAPTLLVLVSFSIRLAAGSRPSQAVSYEWVSPDFALVNKLSRIITTDSNRSH